MLQEPRDFFPPKFFCDPFFCRRKNFRGRANASGWQDNATLTTAKENLTVRAINGVDLKGRVLFHNKFSTLSEFLG